MNRPLRRQRLHLTLLRPQHEWNGCRACGDTWGGRGPPAHTRKTTRPHSGQESAPSSQSATSPTSLSSMSIYLNGIETCSVREKGGE